MDQNALIRGVYVRRLDWMITIFVKNAGHPYVNVAEAVRGALAAVLLWLFFKTGYPAIAYVEIGQKIFRRRLC